MGQSERNALSVLSAAVAVFALVIAGVAVAVANNSSGGGGSGSGGGAAVQTLKVNLSEFKITPSALGGEPGPTAIQVTNAGTLVHNLQVQLPGGNKTLRDLSPGESAVLELGTLKDGEYKILCTIPGHSTSGMTGTLKIGAGQSGGNANGGSANDGSGVTDNMTPDEMDRLMNDAAQTFLKVNGLAEPKIAMKEWGKGGQILEPKIVDGVKEFDLEAKVVDWEVEPGKIVKAWTYNGVVPGPTLKLQPGDTVRIKLTNNLPESTTLHPHGCNVPNAMDGFDPYTQQPIMPGETFTYEWKIPTDGIQQKVCMYHSHHNAQVQVPNGLAGALLIGDLTLPAKFTKDNPGGKVDHEMNMVLNDGGTIGLSLNGRSFPGTAGYVVKKGETMLVNYFNEGFQIHPMHLHAPHGLVFAKDGVELDSPFYSDTINVAPGERWSVLYTFTNPGVWAWHCHILTHAETPRGFRYMATAVIVQ